MTPQLTYLGWLVVLALVQLFLTSSAVTRQYGLKWNAGPRDQALPPLIPLAGRLRRAQDNLMEPLPLFAAAVLIAHAAGRDGVLSLWGCRLYVWGRVIYVPLYAFGVPYVRSLVWVASLIGLLLVLFAILGPA